MLKSPLLVPRNQKTTAERRTCIYKSRQWRRRRRRRPPVRHPVRDPSTGDAGVACRRIAMQATPTKRR